MTYDDELSQEDYKYLAKHLKRTGIFRMYQMNRSLRKTWLLLEFVIKGKVLFTVKIWKYKHSMKNQGI
jgi:hypothetical protein